jgi:hypothetical protein
MIYRVVRFKRWHLDWLIDAGDAEGGRFPHQDAATLRFMEAQNSWTLMVDGTPVMCGGTMQQWPGRHIAWAYLNKLAGRHMRFITKGARRILDGVRGRVEITVREDFMGGHRWARMLGFEEETPLMRGYGPDGEDHVGYVKIMR